MFALTTLGRGAAAVCVLWEVNHASGADPTCDVYQHRLVLEATAQVQKVHTPLQCCALLLFHEYHRDSEARVRCRVNGVAHACDDYGGHDVARDRGYEDGFDIGASEPLRGDPSFCPSSGVCVDVPSLHGLEADLWAYACPFACAEERAVYRVRLC